VRNVFSKAALIAVIRVHHVPSVFLMTTFRMIQVILIALVHALKEYIAYILQGAKLALLTVGNVEVQLIALSVI
jgi:hypothetical protein